ncbi:MAG: hypothetical protein JNJ88_18190 [Planctomycetes bacterium]|nr:hypothetical protein [Planctomycetota bacterium]
MANTPELNLPKSFALSQSQLNTLKKLPNPNQPLDPRNLAVLYRRIKKFAEALKTFTMPFKKGYRRIEAVFADDELNSSAQAVLDICGTIYLVSLLSRAVVSNCVEGTPTAYSATNKTGTGVSKIEFILMAVMDVLSQTPEKMERKRRPDGLPGPRFQLHDLVPIRLIRVLREKARDLRTHCAKPKVDHSKPMRKLDRSLTPIQQRDLEAAVTANGNFAQVARETSRAPQTVTGNVKAALRKLNDQGPLNREVLNRLGIRNLQTFLGTQPVGGREGRRCLRRVRRRE